MKKQLGIEPQALKDKPHLLDSAYWFYNAFNLLSRGRSSGMSINPIPLAEMEAYLRICRIDDPDFSLSFVRLMCQMDNELLSWCNAKQSKKT